MIVEKYESKISRMVEMGQPVIAGDARQEDILDKAEIQSTRLLYVTMNEPSNAFVTLTVKLMNSKIRVVSKSDDTSHNMEKLKKVGVDEIVACHDVRARMMVSKGLSEKTE